MKSKNTLGDKLIMGAISLLVSTIIIAVNILFLIYILKPEDLLMSFMMMMILAIFFHCVYNTFK